jgi:hypothetical protein
MPLRCPESAQLAQFVGRSPWTAADALVGSLGFDEAYFVTQERSRGSAPPLHPNPQFPDN